jgi:hypothetical protein
MKSTALAGRPIKKLTAFELSINDVKAIGKFKSGSAPLPLFYLPARGNCREYRAVLLTMIVGEHTIRLITPSRSIEGNVVVFLRQRLRCIYDNKSNVLAIPFLDHWQYA